MVGVGGSSRLEISKGGAAQVFEGGDGGGFTQLCRYHYSQVLITIIAVENKRSLCGVRIRCIPYQTTKQTVSITLKCKPIWALISKQK